MKKIHDLEKRLLKIIDIFDEISSKPIFMCGEQVVKVGGKEYTLPKCKHVEISFKDYNKLRDAIKLR